MLKLEKNEKKGIVFSFREKDSFFKPDILKALILAIFFHGILLAIFQITPFRGGTAYIFPPLKVRSDYSPIDVRTLQLPNLFEYEGLPPPPSISFYADEDKKKFSEMAFLFQTPHLDSNFLEVIEKREWPFWKLPLHLAVIEPPLKISLSGDLSNYIFKLSHPLLAPLPLLLYDTLDPLSFTFDVLMDSKTGTIFWYEQTGEDFIGRNIQKKIKISVEEILKTIRFNSEEFSSIISGKVHMSIIKSLGEKAND